MPPVSQQQQPAGGDGSSSSHAVSKSQLLSKYYQVPSRTGSYSDAAGFIDSPSGSPTLNGRASPSAGSESQDLSRPESPPNMSFSSSPPSNNALPRVVAYNPQRNGNGVEGSQPRTASIDTTQWGVKYKQNQLHNQMKTQEDLAPAPAHLRPRSVPQAEVEEETPPTTPKASDPSRQSFDGPTLRPLAYSPQPQLENVRHSWDQQSQASWEAGDDDPSRAPPPKPPKIADENPPQMPPIPPQLPPLFFESDGIDQMDFAYQRPQYSRPGSQTRISTSDEEENKSYKNDNAPPVPPLPPAASISPPPSQVPPIPPPIPSKAPPKPSPPPIDTSQAQFNHHRNEDREPIKESQVHNDPDSQDQTFLWPDSPSPNASPKPLEDEKLEPTKSQGSEDQPLTSATALGFGGPSDWEFFGADVEEVDDIDLYTSNKPKTVELPGTSSSAESHNENGEDPDNPPILLGARGRDLSEQRGPILSTIEEIASDKADEDTPPYSEPDIMESKDEDTESGSQNGITPPGTADSGGAPDRSSPASERNSRSRTPGMRDGFEANGGRGNSFNLDTLVASASQPQEPTAPRPESRLQHDTDNLDPHEPGSPKSLAKYSGDEVSIGSKRSAEQIVIQTDVARPALVVNEVRRKSLPRKDVEPNRDSTSKASQLTSPTSDDGKEDIIISLQVPESPPAAGPSTSNITEQRVHYRGSSLGAESGQRSPDLLRTGRMSVYPNAQELDDPYVGLDTWAKSSLNRYIKMLREEAQAPSDEEKYMTFMNFVQKETKNRLVLYDLDDESDFSDQPINRMPSKRKSPYASDEAQARQGQPHNENRPLAVEDEPVSNPPPQNQQVPQNQPQPVQTPQPLPQVQAQPQPQQQAAPSQQPSPVRERMQLKALPALPPPNIPQIVQTGPSPIDDKSKAVQNSFPVPPTVQSNGKAPAPNNKPDDSFVMVDPPKPEQSNSVGKFGGKTVKSNPSLNALRKALDIVTSKKPFTGSNNNTNDPSKATAPESSIGSSAPGPLAMALESGQRSETPPSSGGEKPQNKTPIYSPTSNGEGKPYEGDKAENRKSIYGPFSTMLRQSSVRSGRSEGGTIRSFTSGDKTASITSEAHLRRRTAEEKGKPNYRVTILEPLLNVVPQESVLREEPEALTRLRLGMEATPDDFSFIHKTVLAWDGEAKKTRERYDQERRVRVEQTEHRIDELFNSNQIGYGDISRLEQESKQLEASKKADEDREEVQTFVASVFDTVWARINYEIDQLMPFYEDCTRLVGESLAGKQMFGDNTGRVPIAPAMEILLILYHKLNVRYQKAFEAVLERDRRLKKTEVDPWYAVGHIEKVKHIKERFEEAEKKAILEFCKQRDERANLLMDVLDQNTLRGVGANQDYMESVMQAVRRISMDLALGLGVDGDNDAVAPDDVLKAKTITTALARSSEQIVQTFHVADMLLNAADYEVSVANAKLSNAESQAFRKLRDAKAKEDSKLAMDLEHRMNLIRRDTARTQDEIAKLLMLIQRKDENADGETVNGAAQDGLIDGEQEERLKKALEEAKRRNQEAKAI